MNRHIAQAAIDEGFAAGLTHAFGVLVANLIGDDAEAAKKFGRALAFTITAHKLATATINDTFGDAS